MEKKQWNAPEFFKLGVENTEKSAGGFDANYFAQVTWTSPSGGNNGNNGKSVGNSNSNGNNGIGGGVGGGKNHK